MRAEVKRDAIESTGDAAAAMVVSAIQKRCRFVKVNCEFGGQSRQGLFSARDDGSKEKIHASHHVIEARGVMRFYKIRIDTDSEVAHNLEVRSKARPKSELCSSI